MRTSKFARAEVVLQDLARRYLPTGDLTTGGTALAKVRAETEDPFRVLIATILSQRTRDEWTDLASRRLFAKYSDPESLAVADVGDIERLIHPVNFYRGKARKIREVARVLLERHGGRVPDTYAELLALPQVGPKTANCVLVYGYGRAGIPVDVHVHRVSNRLAIVRTAAPEETEAALKRIVPRDRWYLVNELFVRFGKDICKPIGPRCEVCTFTSFCAYFRRQRRR